MTVHFDAAKVGQAVAVTPLDGGSIRGGEKQLKVGTDGTLRFRFQAAGETGFYQVILDDGVDETAIYFWVLDEKNPNRNPQVLTPAE